MIEIMVQRLYAKCGLTDETDFQRLGSQDYPTLSNCTNSLRAEYKGLTAEQQLYTPELLQNILLRLHSMCRGPEAKVFSSIPILRILLRHLRCKRGPAGQPEPP